MPRKAKYRFTFQECPGSGMPPYRYDPERREGKKNSETGRVIHAKAKCEVCEKMITVNVTGVLRTHVRRVQL